MALLAAMCRLYTPEWDHMQHIMARSDEMMQYMQKVFDSLGRVYLELFQTAEFLVTISDLEILGLMI